MAAAKKTRRSMSTRQIEIEGLQALLDLSDRVRRLEITLAFLVGLNVLQVGANVVAWIKTP